MGHHPDIVDTVLGYIVCIHGLPNSVVSRFNLYPTPGYTQFTSVRMCTWISGQSVPFTTLPFGTGSSLVKMLYRHGAISKGVISVYRRIHVSHILVSSGEAPAHNAGSRLQEPMHRA